MRHRNRRFTVTFEQKDYDKLKVISESYSPKVSLQFIVNLAVKRLIEQQESLNSIRLKRHNPNTD